jgi:hypothetical protein
MITHKSRCRAFAAEAFVVVCWVALPACADSLHERAAEKSLWEVGNLFSPCTGDCGVALLFGKSVSRTPMTSIFVHFQSPDQWQWDDTYMVTLSAQRTWIRYGKYFSLDPEIGFGRRFGDAPGLEGWLALYVRWRYFPWSDYVRTSIGVGVGPSISGNVRIGPDGLANSNGVSIVNYFSPELEIGLPSQPNFNLVVRYHHRSSVWNVIPNDTDDPNFWTVGMRINF